MRHNLTIILVGLIVLVSIPATAQQPPNDRQPQASLRRATEPVVFGYGVLSTDEFDSHPAFTPDGRTVYFVRSTPNFSLWTILVSRLRNGRWSLPEVAPFSGRYSDADPFITHDGKRLYFISNRPVGEKKTRDLDIWFVEQTSNGAWGEPKNLHAPINSDGAEWYPTLTRDGTIYFGSDRAGGKGRTDIYRSRLINGSYVQAENLGEPINTPSNEFEPFVSLDENFVIFMAGGRTDALGGFDLYISYYRDSKWTRPANLGNRINSSGNEYSPTISPDGKYFFWTSTRGFGDNESKSRLNFPALMHKLRRPGNGLGDIYQIEIGMLGIGK